MRKNPGEEQKKAVDATAAVAAPLAAGGQGGEVEALAAELKG